MKTAIIMRGCPGSGKSTWLSNNFKGVVCSADDYRMVDGQYVFDERTKDAHSACLRKFVSEMVEVDCGDVAVDNTNSTRAEVSPYYRLAQAYGYNVRIVTIMADVELCIKRNVHNVPANTIRKMANRWESCKDWGEEVFSWELGEMTGTYRLIGLA